jgi:hypothetical protein
MSKDLTRARCFAMGLIFLFCAGCVTPQPKAVVVPPAPQPVAPPPAPLVFPQNVYKAPAARPVPPEAIPVLPPGGIAMAPEPEVPVPPTRVPPRVAAVPAPAVRTEPLQTPPPPEVLSGGSPRQPAALQNRGDQARNRLAISTRIRNARAVLGQLAGRSFTGQARDDRDRAASMLDVAEQALNRGDLRQADDLSDRAAILANILLNGK